MTLPRIGRAGLVAWLIISSESPALADAKACAADDCPALVRNDCQEWGAAVTEALPSIIVDARDASGHDVGDVLVTMDGELLTKSVNGTAITVDPGPHTFVAQRPRSPRR